MKFITLFFNAMQMTSKIDCRRFAVGPGYQQALESELCGDVPSRRPVRTISAEKAAAETQPWALSH